MRILSLLALFLLSAQIGHSQVISYPKASLTLKIQQSSGTNASAVVYDPKTELYYSIFAGNAKFPLEVFNSSGNNVYQTNTGNDLRGAWWNKKTGQIEANCATADGWISIGLDDKGFPSLGNNSIFSGTNHQPNMNAVGAFDGKKYVYYWWEGKIHIYSRKTGDLMKSTAIQSSHNLAEINLTTIAYTGQKKMELGVLNWQTAELYLINKKDFKITQTVTLPAHVLINNSFRWSFANNHLFIYDADMRTWTGYKIFQ